MGGVAAQERMERTYENPPPPVSPLHPTPNLHSEHLLRHTNTGLCGYGIAPVL